MAQEVTTPTMQMNEHMGPRAGVISRQSFRLKNGARSTGGKNLRRGNRSIRFIVFLLAVATNTEICSFGCTCVFSFVSAATAFFLGEAETWEEVSQE